MQFYSGRAEGQSWDDTYNTKGNHYHHNFFDQLGRESLYIAQDFSQAYQNDLNRSAGGFSDIEPEFIPQFYSAAKPLKIKKSDLNRTQANYQTVIGFIFKNKDNRELLNKGLQRFNERTLSERHFVTKRQSKLIRDAFKKHL